MSSKLNLQAAKIKAQLVCNNSIDTKQYSKREVANLLIEAMAVAVKNDRTENHIPIDEFSIDWIEKRLQM